MLLDDGLAHGAFVVVRFEVMFAGRADRLIPCGDAGRPGQGVLVGRGRAVVGPPQRGVADPAGDLAAIVVHRRV